METAKKVARALSLLASLGLLILGFIVIVRADILEIGESEISRSIDSLQGYVFVIVSVLYFILIKED